MLKRATLLQLANERASAQANTQELDESRTDDLVAEAKAVVDDFFDSITWQAVENNVIKSRDPIDSWRHRTPEDQEQDWRYMSFSRSSLQGAAERYLDRPWLQSREMDWLVVDVLLYAEYQATLDFLRIGMMPMSRYIAGQLGTRSAVAWSSAWRGLMTGLKWLLWTALFTAAAAAMSPVGPIAVVVVTVAWLLWKWRTRRRLNALLAVMRRTYAHLSTVSQGWRVLWQELNDSRTRGAVWDGVVYRLVEERMRTSNATV